MSMIPVNNKPALIGYYLGIAALIPCIGCFFGVAAVVMGFMGLSRAGQLNGEGKVHAIVALVLGFVSIIFNSLGWLLLIASAASQR
ncbi:MAG TPA: DUF4190 domain-containing protein [Pirellulaceae bacterium]|jgi:uncharacterized membrane protein|nr:DUF4190 domain-containing protein [Pirellulaceae bacterium]